MPHKHPEVSAAGSERPFQQVLRELEDDIAQESEPSDNDTEDRILRLCLDFADDPQAASILAVMRTTAEGRARADAAEAARASDATGVPELDMIQPFPDADPGDGFG